MVELIRAAPIATLPLGDHCVVFKQSGCVFDADSDLEAVGYWLQSKANKSINTSRPNCILKSKANNIA